jgi:DNA repair protein RecN (Recombination protein N)
MLRELHIKNFSIIDDATVEFEEGFNVLTGETGAGKSIIVNALSMTLGERASGDFVRSGEKEAVVEAYFDIPRELIKPDNLQFLRDNGIDTDEGVILKRIVTAQGRSRAYINGSMVNVQTLSDISRDIIDVHGQYEHQSLLSSDNQLDLLDAYGGLFPAREKVSGIYESHLAVKRQISDLTQKEKDRARRIDILQFQLSEIDAAGLNPGEEEQLEEEVKILANAGRLAELANESYESLYSSDTSCLANLSAILNHMKEISCIDDRASDSVMSLEEAIPLLEEASFFLRDYKDKIDFSPERLESSQERLELIRNLKRKYGSDIPEILDYREKSALELEELHYSEETLEVLHKELAEHKKQLTEKAHALSNKRKTVSKKIEAKVENELSELSMAGTKFSIRITQEKGDDTTDGLKAAERGIDNLEFLIAPNVGEELRPVSKTASGGELSRIMLALKGILAKGDSIPVLIFDEIDSGIGGKAAGTVGEKLKHLASSHQIISITHLPQIASYAANHLQIQKKTRDDRTMVEVHKIEKKERIEEVARMLSGATSDASLKHAKELLKKSTTA